MLAGRAGEIVSRRETPSQCGRVGSPADTGTSQYWQILEISGVPVLTKNVIFTFFRTCWCYSEAYNTRTQK